MPNRELLPLSAQEMAALQKIAKRDGVTVDEVATRLIQEALAARVRRHTGKGPARVFSIPGKD